LNPAIRALEDCPARIAGQAASAMNNPSSRPVWAQAFGRLYALQSAVPLVRRRQAFCCAGAGLTTVLSA
jgi:hypothetical protein